MIYIDEDRVLQLLPLADDFPEPGMPQPAEAATEVGADPHSAGMTRADLAWLIAALFGPWLVIVAIAAWSRLP